MGKSAIDVRELSPEDRLQLIEEIWDSLSDEDVPLTDPQRRELDRRLDEMERDGPGGIPWQEVLDRLRAGTT